MTDDERNVAVVVLSDLTSEVAEMLDLLANQCEQHNNEYRPFARQTRGG